MITITISRQKLIVGGIAAALVLVKMWLVEVQDMLVMGSIMDDVYFVRTANELLSGQWLGVFSQYTHMAGPMYPMWIALCYLLTVPLHTGQLLLYTAACAVAVYALRPLVQRKYWLVLGFAYLLFNPFTYDYSSSPGVFRLGVYPALSLLVIACAIGVYTRTAQPDGRPLRWALGLGFAFAAFWYTREEGMWLIPTLLFAGLFAAVHGITRGRRPWFAVAGILVVPIAVWIGAFLTLATVNWQHYGIFTDLEIKSSEFKAAYAALIRVRSDQRERYVLLEEPAREMIAEVSPAFREVRPELEKSGWLKNAGGKIPAVMFIWAWREAVRDAGYYDPKDPPATLRFYERLADEINAACADGRLNCDRLYASFLPAWDAGHAQEFPAIFVDTLNKVVRFYRFDSHMTPKWVSHASPEVITLFEYLTGERARTAETLGHIPSAHAGISYFKTHRLMRIGRKYYQHTAPWLAGLALGALVLALLAAAFRKTLSNAAVVALVVFAGLVSNVLLITVVRVMAVTAQRHFHVAHAFTILFCVVGVIVLARTIGDIRGRATHE